MGMGEAEPSGVGYSHMGAMKDDTHRTVVSILPSSMVADESRPSLTSLGLNVSLEHLSPHVVLDPGEFASHMEKPVCELVSVGPGCASGPYPFPQFLPVDLNRHSFYALFNSQGHLTISEDKSGG